MLRQSLSRWLDRKSVRPVMSRVGRSAAKPRTTPAAAAYQTGDVDDLHESEQLDLMEDIPIEPLGRPASATARDPHGRATPAQALLSRLEETHPLSPAGATRSVEERAVARAPRRVMSTLRRPHTPSTPSTAAAENTFSEAPRGTLGHHRAADEEGAETEADHAAGAATSTTADASQDGGAAADHDVSAVASTLGGAGDASPAVAKSADAYRFLLNHIDAEIAALQRRHSSVTTRRQHVQTKQTQRIKELFELMEAPWTLLPTEEQPALPATGVDVYIKEQQVARQRRQGGSSGSPTPSSSPPSASSSSASSPAASAAAGASAHDGPDKMYVLALHKNYKSMPAGRKRFYEEAAHYNAAVREEMKYQLTRGCARFEAFLDRVKECTMEMAREGQVPELPSVHAHRIAAAGGQRSERWRTTSGGSGSGGSGASGSATRRKAGAASAESKLEVSADESSTPEADTAEQPAAPATGKGKKAVAAASRRLKAAAKAKTKTAAPPKRKGGAAKATKAAKTSSTRSSAAAKQKKTAKVAPPSKKSAEGSAKSGGAGSSRSIPLPDLNQLALKKIKQLATPPGKGSKATKTKAVGGKKKKK